MKTNRKFVPAFIAAVFASPTAFAQQLPDVVITSTKSQTTLQNTPVSVSVTSADALDKAQIQDLKDLTILVPSLAVVPGNTSNQSFFVIRGFGNGGINPGLEPSVAVIVDGVSRLGASAQIGDMLDVQRVEVLRGPQSTLFGQSASAGVISIVSKRPSFQFGGEAEAGLGNDGAKLFKARVTGPISESLAYTLAGSVNQRDGNFENLANGSMINDRKRWDFHGQLLYEASENLSVRLIADAGHIDDHCCGAANLYNGPTGALIQALGGNIYTGDKFDRRGYLNFSPSNVIDNNGVSLHVNWDFGSAQLTSITAQRSSKAVSNFDADFTSVDAISNPADQRRSTFSQELRLASNKDGPLNWMLGGYYSKESMDYSNSILMGTAMRNYATGLVMGGGGSATALSDLEKAVGVPAGTFFRAGQGVGLDATQDSSALTFFGHIDWKPTKELQLSAGLAHTAVRKDVDFSTFSTDVFSQLNLVNIGYGGALAGGVPSALADRISITPCTAKTYPMCNSALALYSLQFLPPVVPFKDSSNDGKWTYLTHLMYKLNENLNVYGSVSTGFKATSWNLSVNSAPLAPATADRSPAGGYANPYYGRYGSRFAGPETSTAYEIGLKGKWQTLALNAALFDQSIRGFQANIFQGAGFLLANAGNLNIKGIELDANYKPSKSWEFSVAGNYLFPKFDSFVNGACVDGPCDLSGSRPVGIRGVNLSTAVTYNWKMDDLAWFARLAHRYGDNVQLVENVPASVASAQVSTIDVSLGVKSGSWDAALWCHNLTNDNFITSAFPSVAQAGSYTGYLSAPRTFGVTVRKSF